jgi:hypothetical protein
MVEVTDEMVELFRLNHDPANPEEQPDIRSGIAAVLHIVERDNQVHPLCAATLGTGLRCEYEAGMAHPDEHSARAPRAGTGDAAARPAGAGHPRACVMAFPRFAPDADLVVDAHNGPEHWTGAEWNAYVTSAERNSNMVTARLIQCPDPLAESTSATLRRVEQERDEALAKLRTARDHAREADEAEEHMGERWRAAVRQRDEARAELASARTELASIREVVNRRAADLHERADREPIEPSACSQVFLKDMDTATAEELRTEVRRLDLRLRWMHTHYDDEATTFLLTAYELGDQRDALRTELDAVRTARDNLDRDLALARREIAEQNALITDQLCVRCGIAVKADITDGTPGCAS